MRYLLIAALLISTACHAQTVDKKFIALNGGYLAAGIIDSELTQSCIHDGTCHEGNPYMPKSQLGQIGVAVGMTAISTGISYYLRKNHVKVWWLPTAVGYAAHGYGIYTGYKFVR